MNVFIESRISDDNRRKLLYDGAIFVDAPSPNSLKLCQLARDLVEEAFGAMDPRKVQESMSAGRAAEILSVLKPKFIHHPKAKECIQGLLADLGCDLGKTYFDVPRLRTAFPGEYLKSGIAYAFHPHRDTLIRNSSSQYNYYKWDMESRHNAAQHVKHDTRVQPRPQEPVELVPQFRLICEPGAFYRFSAAQLHSTVPNTSDLTRYSIDFRTVHLDDVWTRTGAPNIDSACTGTSMSDFLRGRDFSPLPSEALALYQDGTELQYNPPSRVV